MTDQEKRSVTTSNENLPLVTKQKTQGQPAKTTAEKEAEKRGQWTGKLDFIFSCLGFAIGLGNFWRFPYLCYKNGGGVFLIPYFMCLFCVGIPIFLIEISLGQFMSQGPLTCWEFAPIFRGIGFGMMMVSALIGFYYNTIIAWAIWYFFASISLVLPWSKCKLPWGSELCSTFLNNDKAKNCTGKLIEYGNGTCYNTTSNKLVGISNVTLARANGIREKLPAADFLDNVGFQLSRSTGIDGLGTIRWDMTLAFLLAWSLVFIFLIRGVKTSGKVVYFTVLFPYVALMVFLFNVVGRNGFVDGVYFYLKPNVALLGKSSVWKDAAVQVFFSLGLCQGGMTALASYNKFDNNIVRDVFVIAIGNSCTSLLAGFSVFGYLGVFAKKLDVSIHDVVNSGTALAFIVYPQAIAMLPASTFWSLLFFFTLMTLGIDSQLVFLETVITCIIDFFGFEGKYQFIVRIATIGLLFLLSLVMATPGGPYIVTLMDDYSSGWNVIVLALVMCGSIVLYGLKRFCQDIEIMSGPNPLFCLKWKYVRWYFMVCWGCCAPIFLLFVFFNSLIKYAPSHYGPYVFPTWVNALGWMVTLMVLSACFITMGIDWFTTPGTIKEKYKLLFKPSAKWLAARELCNKNSIHGIRTS